MSAQTLSIESIKALDLGAAGLIINDAIDRAVSDLDDRGEDEAVRKVKVEIRMKKRPDGNIEVAVAAKAELPPRLTSSQVMGLKQTGKGKVAALFQEWDKDNPNQSTMDLEGGDGKTTIADR